MKNRLAVNSTDFGTYGKATLSEPRTEADYFARRRFEAGRHAWPTVSAPAVAPALTRRRPRPGKATGIEDRQRIRSTFLSAPTANEGVGHAENLRGVGGRDEVGSFCLLLMFRIVPKPGRPNNDVRRFPC